MYDKEGSIFFTLRPSLSWQLNFHFGSHLQKKEDIDFVMYKICFFFLGGEGGVK